MNKILSVVLTAALASTAMAVSGPEFYLQACVDTNALGVAGPGSVAYNGTDLYVGQLFNSTAGIHRIGAPLGTPSVLNSFGGSVAGNGWVNLDVGSNYVVGASNNSGANDVLRTFSLDGAAQLGSKIPGDIGRTRFDGAAADPGWVSNGGAGAGVSLTSFGSGFRNQRSVDLNTELDNAFSIFVTNWGTGTRDIAYDEATGNMFIRMVNGVVRGNRSGPQNFVKLDNTTAGLEGIVFLPNVTPFPQSAINVDFLPDWNGEDMVVLNDRFDASNPLNPAPTFANRVKFYRAGALNDQVTPSFLNLDGTPFVAADSSSGIYDFSYDASSGLLAMSDFTNSKVYFFARTPEPASLALLALAGLLIRRR